MKRIKIFAVTLAISLAICSPVSAATYLSGASSWAKDGITQATENGIVYDDLLSNYQTNITREEFCKLVVSLYRSVGGQIPGDYAPTPFSDTIDEDVAIAYRLGIVSGISRTEFAPNASITREQIAVMLYSMLEQVYIIENPGDITHYTDYEQVSSWARGSLSAINALGIINGYSATQIAPLDNTTREQAIVMANNVYGLLADTMKSESNNNPQTPQDTDSSTAPNDTTIQYYPEFPWIPTIENVSDPIMLLTDYASSATKYLRWNSHTYLYNTRNLDDAEAACEAYSSYLQDLGFFFVSKKDNPIVQQAAGSNYQYILFSPDGEYQVEIESRYTTGEYWSHSVSVSFLWNAYVDGIPFYTYSTTIPDFGTLYDADLVFVTGDDSSDICTFFYDVRSFDTNSVTRYANLLKSLGFVGVSSTKLEGRSAVIFQKGGARVLIWTVEPDHLAPAGTFVVAIYR